MPNALADETSPYLRQHADNPVQWYPWCEEALERARCEDKPILLSIGYSACHWCHVMAHESFEDEDTAAIMNTHFINIKVDREERPDLDRIYQLAQQLLTRRTGGWPLTMFLTPDDHIPFFGGTYFPRESRYGLPSFKDLLLRVAEYYRAEKDAIRHQNQAMTRALEALVAPPAPAPGAEPDAEPLAAAFKELKEIFDARWGGFGGAPKFPHATNLERLLRHHALSGNSYEDARQALDMALLTLRRMAEGGIYDHLGGGFCRYSVDQYWAIPHFEKMLYDNGPLLALYAEAWQITRDPQFERVANETADFLMKEMQSQEGGYYSSLDADSEGEEGKFYVWTDAEVRSLLEETEYRIIARHYGLNLPANFEGRWHLRIARPLPDVAAELGLDLQDAAVRLDRARMKLRAARRKRARPGRDDKILTSWNALAIKGMATAGRILNRADCLDSAQVALDFIRTRLWHLGRLYATYKDGRARFNAYLDDHAFLIDAILALLQSRWRSRDLEFAVELADALLARFADETGGFFFTSHDHERLILRSKPLQDESLPSGNGIAAFALQRLGHLLGETRYLNACAHTLKMAWPSITHLPAAHNALLLALEEHLYPPELVVIRGAEPEIGEWRLSCQSDFRPRRLVFAIPAAEADLPGLLAKRRPAPDSTIAYVCTGVECRSPVTRLEALEELLRGG